MLSFPLVPSLPAFPLPFFFNVTLGSQYLAWFERDNLRLFFTKSDLINLYLSGFFYLSKCMALLCDQKYMCLIFFSLSITNFSKSYWKCMAFVRFLKGQSVSSQKLFKGVTDITDTSHSSQKLEHILLVESGTFFHGCPCFWDR